MEGVWVGLWAHNESGSMESESGSKKRKALSQLFPGSHAHFHKAAPKITGQEHIAVYGQIYDQTWVHITYS